MRAGREPSTGARIRRRGETFGPPSTKRCHPRGARGRHGVACSRSVTWWWARSIGAGGAARGRSRSLLRRPDATEIAERLASPRHGEDANPSRPGAAPRGVGRPMTHEPIDTRRPSTRWARSTATSSSASKRTCATGRRVRGGAVRLSPRRAHPSGRRRAPCHPRAVRDALLRRVEASSRPRLTRYGCSGGRTLTRRRRRSRRRVHGRRGWRRAMRRPRHRRRATAQLRDQIRREQALIREEITRARAVATPCAIRHPRGALNGLAPAPSAAGRVVCTRRRVGQLYVTACAGAAGKALRAVDDRRRTPKPAGVFDGTPTAPRRVGGAGSTTGP